jgi:hypothetical protein
LTRSSGQEEKEKRRIMEKVDIATQRVEELRSELGELNTVLLRLQNAVSDGSREDGLNGAIDGLESKEAAKLQVAMAFSLLSLVYTSLACDGHEDLKAHPLHKELERVKTYLTRLNTK